MMNTAWWEGKGDSNTWAGLPWMNWSVPSETRERKPFQKRESLKELGGPGASNSTSEIECMVFLLNLTHSWFCPSPHPSSPATWQLINSLSLVVHPLAESQLLAPSGSTLLHQFHLISEPTASLQDFHSSLLAGCSSTSCFSLPNQSS